MKNPLFALLLISITFLSSCNPKVSTKLSKSYPAISNKQEVIIIDKKESKPDSSEILGVVKIGDTGFTTNCSLDTLLNRAKLEARKAGGNAIKINEIKPPSTVGSSCYRISATILKINKITTDDDVKKAYLAMAKKYHPDKVIHLGKEHQVGAEEKFRQVQAAYEQLQKEPGF